MVALEHNLNKRAEAMDHQNAIYLRDLENKEMQLRNEVRKTFEAITEADYTRLQQCYDFALRQTPWWSRLFGQQVHERTLAQAVRIYTDLKANTVQKPGIDELEKGNDEPDYDTAG